MVRTAVVAGVGPGLGESLARRFIEEGCQVGLLARSADYLDDISTELGDKARAIPTDISNPDQVVDGFEQVREPFGSPDILINHASVGAWKGLQEITPSEFEQAWRVAAYGGLLCSQEVIEDMIDTGGGTIVFTGATSAVRGRGGSLGFSAAKFAVRGMAESMARDLGPEGIHVAHVIIDGQIDTPRVREMYPDRADETFLDPDAIADSYWHLVEQDGHLGRLNLMCDHIWKISE